MGDALLTFFLLAGPVVATQAGAYAEVSSGHLCIGVIHYCMHVWCPLSCETFGRDPSWIPLGATLLCFGYVRLRTHALQRGG